MNQLQVRSIVVWIVRFTFTRDVQNCLLKLLTHLIANTLFFSWQIHRYIRRVVLAIYAKTLARDLFIIVLFANLASRSNKCFQANLKVELMNTHSSFCQGQCHSFVTHVALKEIVALTYVPHAILWFTKNAFRCHRG